MLLEFFGDIDFIVERIQDPGWMRDVYLHVVNFSPQGNMAILLVSLLAFAYFIKFPADKRIAETPLDTTELIDSQRLVIEYSQDQAFSIGPSEGHGLDEGPWISAKITIVNKDHKLLHNVKASIVSIINHDEKFPDQLKGKVTLPISLPILGSGPDCVNLNPSESQSSEVFHHHQTFLDHTLRFGSKDSHSINSGPYAIKIKATSQEESSDCVEFIVGLCKRPTGGGSDPYFKPTISSGITLKQKRELLYELRAEGVQLRDERLSTVAMFDVWNDKYEIWHLRVLRIASNLDSELKHRLRPLDKWQPWNLGSPVNTQHETALEIISETLARIGHYLEIPSGSH